MTINIAPLFFLSTAFSSLLLYKSNNCEAGGWFAQSRIVGQDPLRDAISCVVVDLRHIIALLGKLDIVLYCGEEYDRITSAMTAG